MDSLSTPARSSSAAGAAAARARRPGFRPAAGAVRWLALAAALALTGCDRAYEDRAYERIVYRSWAQLPPPPDSVVFRPESLVVRAERTAHERALFVRYRPYVVRDKHSLWKLRLKIGEDALRMALRVSRTDVAHAQKGDTLLVPDQTDWIKLSPFPGLLLSASGLPKLMLVSLRVQAFGAYENGVLMNWGPTSTGREDKPTPPGIYFANWKSKERISSIDDGWVLKWAVNLDAYEGIAIHEFGLPGRPASHSCVRLTEEDARWFFEWADGWRVSGVRKRVVRRGTPVVVFGEYDYRRRRPWFYLLADYRSNRLTKGELDAVVAAFISARARRPNAPYIALPLPPAATPGQSPARGGTVAGRAGAP